MSETVSQTAETTPAEPVPAKRTDGQDGPPVLPPAAVVVSAPTPGAPNSALKETPAPGDGVSPAHPAKAQDVRIIDAEAGVVEGGRKKYAICGFASSSRTLAPVHDPEWEIWGLNQLYRHIPRADRWFEIHKAWNTEVVPGTDHHGWIRDCGIPVYMVERDPALPTSVRFPIRYLIETFTDYYTSTIAFMVALALDEIDRKVAGRLLAMTEPVLPHAALALVRSLYREYTIGVFGVDLIVGEEYDWQKSCVEFWLGAAALGRGITVVLPPTSALCKQLYRYGYEAEPDAVVKPNELKTHAQTLLKEKNELIAKLHQIDGALAADDYWAQLVTLRLRGGTVTL